jgi:anti-sigma regulatory factor (Ser/Thr protein kinase)
VRLSSVKYGLFRILKILNLYEFFEFEEGTVESKPEMEKAWQGAVSMPSLRLSFLPTSWAIKDALDRFHDFLTKLNVREICAFDLETVFYEVTTNIRLHGQLDDDDCMEFTATPTGDLISLRFVDPGPMFDPTSDPPHFDPDRAIRRRQSSGFGLTMIRRLVDSISYQRRDDGRNVVTLTKRLSRKWRMGL